MFDIATLVNEECTRSARGTNQLLPPTFDGTGSIEGDRFRR
ncbi:unannotated protein [freshwater metagenome]|uniref:Unannotated protein n=1 Tax=freshwater metagenome TaxID=449393 RepID=A0A6J6ZQ60_9ZZZZ